MGKRASLSAIYFHLGPGEVKRPRCAPTRLAGGGPDRSAARSAAGESSAAVGDAGRARFFRACAGCGGGGRSANLEQSTGDCGVRQSTCRWCSQGEGRINPQRPLQCLCVYVSWLRELFGAFQNCSAREGVERNDGALPSKRSTTQDLPMPPLPSFPAPLNPPRAVAWPPRARPEHLPPIGKCPAGSKPGPLPTRADFIFVGRACAARGLIDHARYVHVPTSMESLTGYSYPMKCTGAYRGYGHVPPLGGS